MPVLRCQPQHHSHARCLAALTKLQRAFLTGTSDLLTQQVEVHQKSVHLGPANTGPPANVTNIGSSKTDKKTHCANTNQMSEESWRFFLDEWSRYKRQTGIKYQELLDELWNCMTDDLRSWPSLRGEPPTSLQKQT